MDNLQTFALAALEGSAVTSLLPNARPPLSPRQITHQAYDIAAQACADLGLDPHAEAITGQITVHHTSRTQ